MKTIIFAPVFILLFLWTSVLIAQGSGPGPGYMGKHYYFEAGFSAMPAFRGPTPRNNSISGGTFALNTRYQARLGMILARFYTLNLEYDYLKTAVTFRNRLYGINAHVVSLKMQYIFSTAAPIGGYYGFGIATVFGSGALYPHFALELGVRKIIKDRFILYMGVDGNAPMYYAPFEDDKLNHAIQNRLVRNLAVYLKAGIGVLLF